MKMILHLTISKSENTTVGDVRKIRWALEHLDKYGYEIEILPWEIEPSIIVITKEIK